MARKREEEAGREREGDEGGGHLCARVHPLMRIHVEPRDSCCPIFCNIEIESLAEPELTLLSRLG